MNTVCVLLCLSATFVSTFASDFCYDGEIRYKPGDSYVLADCSGQCTCGEGGNVGCVSLCGPSNVMCNDDEVKIQSSRKIADSDCSCPTFECVKSTDLCYDGGKRYKPGDTYVTADCLGRCYCGGGGNVACVSLCPPSHVMCNDDEVKIQSSRKIADTDCSCPTYECVKSTDICHDGGKKYKPGASYISADCSGRCTCDEGGAVSCVSLCPVAFMICNNDEVRVQSSRKIADSDCSCSYSECVKATDICHDGGKKYKPGDSYISADCSGRCTCDERGAVSCVSLCPPAYVICNDDEVEVQSSRKIADSDCSCSYPECVKATDVCYDGGKRYKPGDRYVAANCSGYCTCRKGGAIGCVSLCPPMVVKCKKNEIKKRVMRKIPNSRCSCPRYVCSKHTKS